MIGLIMMNETICAPLTEKLPELLKTGKCSASRLNNGKMNRKHLNSLLFFSGVRVAFFRVVICRPFFFSFSGIALTGLVTATLKCL